MRADVAGCRARRRRDMFWYVGRDWTAEFRDRDHRQVKGGERRYGGTMDWIGLDWSLDGSL